MTRGQDSPVTRVSASFRDPAGHVYQEGGRILRTIRSRAAADYQRLRDAGVYQRLIDAGKLVRTHEASERPRAFDTPDVHYLLEHERLPLISYPYEWPFAALKAAALFHLELQKELLAADAVLCDASAYNIQFVGPRPVLIDFLSLRPYSEGEYWLGHRQFCEHFLFPLLLRSLRGIPHNGWLRGSPDGNSGDDLAELVPFSKKLSLRMLMHVVLPQYFKGRERDKLEGGPAPQRRQQSLPRAAYLSMLNQLHAWIASLEAPKGKRSSWDDYTLLTSYSNDQVGEKLEFVQRFVQEVRPAALLDVGCNTGEFSELALAHGAASVIGLDFDPHACDNAFARARARKLNLTVLQVDMSNPSPSQGWRGREHQALEHRLGADALVALAVIHHFVIGKNLPLEDVVDYLVGLAPQGVIEFVGKEDEQVRRMLRFREDIFPDYGQDAFMAAVRSRATIVETRPIKDGHRLMVRYARAVSAAGAPITEFQ